MAIKDCTQEVMARFNRTKKTKKSPNRSKISWDAQGEQQEQDKKGIEGKLAGRSEPGMREPNISK